MKFINQRIHKQAKIQIRNANFAEGLKIYIQLFSEQLSHAKKNPILMRQKNFLDAYLQTLLNIIEVTTLIVDRLRVESELMDQNSLFITFIKSKAFIESLEYFANNFIEVYDSIENKQYLKTTQSRIKKVFKFMLLNMESLGDLAAEIAEKMNIPSKKSSLLALSAQSMRMAIDYSERFPIDDYRARHSADISLHLAFLLSMLQQYKLTKAISCLEKIAEHIEFYNLFDLTTLQPANELELLCYGLEVDYHLYDKTESDLIERGNKLILAEQGLEQQGINDFKAAVSLFNEFNDHLADDEDAHTSREKTSQNSPAQLEFFSSKHQALLVQSSMFGSPLCQISPVDSPLLPERHESSSEASPLSASSNGLSCCSFFSHIEHQEETAAPEETRRVPRMSFNRFDDIY